MTQPTGEHPVTKADLKHQLNVELVRTLAGSVVVGIAIAFGAYWAVLAKAEAQTDAGVKVVSDAHASTKERLAEHIRDSGTAHRQMREELHEVQMDIRALYRSIQTGRPSARLEAPPLADGGR